MTLGETLGLSERRERLLSRGLQLLLAGLAVGGLLTGRPGITANALPALFVTLLPALLRRQYGYVVDSGLALWITVAVVLHSVGALGPYRWYSWYDEVTHVVSGSLVAGVGYAALRAFEEHSADVDVDGAFRGLFAVIFVLAFGVVWEVFEFGAVRLGETLGSGSPVRVFGIDDIVTDMIANTAGGVLVALWGTEQFGRLTSFFRARLDDADTDGR